MLAPRSRRTLSAGLLLNSQTISSLLRNRVDIRSSSKANIKLQRSRDIRSKVDMHRRTAIRSRAAIRNSKANIKLQRSRDILSSKVDTRNRAIRSRECRSRAILKLRAADPRSRAAQGKAFHSKDCKLGA